MNIEEAKSIPLEDYLRHMGFSPVRQHGDSIWYCSPFREEKTPSFKVSESRNLWYDFGLGQGGDIITLAMELQKTRDISYALKAIEGHFPAVTRTAASSRRAESQATGYRQVCADPLTNPVLLDYLQERGIPPEIAKKICKEVHFQNKGKWYFAVAFANRSGGYEIRNKYLKGSISPKEVTHIRNGSDRCIVFEGFMDYLSYLTLKATHPANKWSEENSPDYIVLNSTGNAGRAIPVLKEYKSVICLLDNDPAGKKVFRKMAEAGCPVIDKSDCYRAYNDLNDYLLDKKIQQENKTGNLRETAPKKIEKPVTKQSGWKL